ncbi:MAG: hypothetical protein JNK87_29665 [Bryobacterales bacterium]|nr:hypothetical protein [Bryobacterales bacterium]
MRIAIFLIIVGVLGGDRASAQPTYSREVSRIVAEKCQICHRPNDIAPFSLLSYEDAQTWAEDIKRVVSERIMPPWKPVEGHGEFRDSYALSEEQRQTLIQWADAGAPLGDPAELPEVTAPTGEWQLGDPDMVVTMPESYTPPRGKDDYRCFVVSNPFDEPMYVKTADVIPGNRRIVHHVILYLDTRGQGAKLDEAEPGPGYTCFGGPGVDLDINAAVAGWAPGSAPKRLPDGIAVQIPKGAQVIMQVHYYARGVTAEDQTRVGLYFAKERIERRLFYVPVLNTRFTIPPGNAIYPVTANFPIPPLLDARAIQIFPHMHLLGRQIIVEYTEPRQTTPKPLIRIDDWDFNWQGFYNFKDPVPLPALSNIRLRCTFDNSEGNPRNPSNPLKPVGWGEGTEDEMCVAFLGVVFERENLLPFSTIQQR